MLQCDAVKAHDGGALCPSSAQVMESCGFCLASQFWIFLPFSPKSSCREIIQWWKKKENSVCFFSNHWPCSLAESSRIIAEAPEATRPVGREITVSEELAHCLALLESDTHEEVPTQGKEGSCRGFMKCVKKYSSYGSRKFTNSRGTCCAPERSWNINTLMERLILLHTVHAWWVHSLRSL